MRQTWEEIGIDLAEKDFMLVGQLDDREITTSLGKRLLMILSPFGAFEAAAPRSDLSADEAIVRSIFTGFPTNAFAGPKSWNAITLDSTQLSSRLYFVLENFCEREGEAVKAPESAVVDGVG